MTLTQKDITNGAGVANNAEGGDYVALPATSEEEPLMVEAQAVRMESDNVNTNVNDNTNANHNTAAGNPLFSILWLLLLIWIAWPISSFCAGIWILLQPFEACFDFVRTTNKVLEKVVTWPRECGQAIVDGSPNVPAPFLD